MLLIATPCAETCSVPQNSSSSACFGICQVNRQCCGACRPCRRCKGRDPKHCPARTHVSTILWQARRLMLGTGSGMADE